MKIFTSFKDMAEAIGELPLENEVIELLNNLNRTAMEKPKEPKKIISPSPIMQKDNPKLKPIEVEGEITSITCKDCGIEFFMSPNEVRFYEEKDFPLPKRCKLCRKRRKEEKANYSFND